MEKALKRKRKTKWILFWAFLLTGFAIFAVEACLPKYYQNKRNFATLEKLERENQGLKQEIELAEIKMKAIRTDAFYNEVVARRELRMKKPGERVIKVRASVASKAINGSNPEAGSSAPHPLFVKVLFNRKIQAFLLAVAYILIATAFLFFNEKEYKSTKLPRKAYG